MVQGVSVVDNCIVNINPATGEEINRIPCSTKEQIETMIQTASDAQEAWFHENSLAERIVLLRKALAAVKSKSAELVPLITQEMGKPKGQAQEEVEGATDKDAYFELLEKTLQPQARGDQCSVIRQPLGVVVVLSPWNFPVDEILLLALPSLASGNAAIVKPSEVTPGTGGLVVEALASVLPKGVLQLAQGDGAVGAQLVAHEKVNMIAMTGSSATGRKIVSTAAPQLKRVVLELGGKDPMIVFGDADLEKAAEDAVAYSLDNTGQVCCSTERIYVQDSVYDEFSQKVAEAAKKYKVGNGMDDDVKVGPMVSPVQKEIVKEHVDDAVKKGAKLLYQSPVPEGKGNFFPVTVLSQIKSDMQLHCQETFGPVVSLSPFDGSEKEAVRLANDTPYGLASSVYTKDITKAERVANRIDAGQVGINCYALMHMDVGCPWVGHKQSGYGYHSGPEGFQQFSVPKTLVFSEPKK